jgi:glycosidase
MLDAQFDFNVYHTAIDAIGREGGSMAEIARVVSESGRAYGSHHVMGNISGNHDKARFISLVGGELSFDEDHKYAGWNRKVGVGNADVAYPRLALLEAINFCIPGVPCLYQGDEYGQPGANDPDNRRMMRFDGYTSLEQQHLDKMKTMAELRRNSLPLIYGDYLPLYADKDVYAFARVYLGEWVICAFSNAEQVRTVTLSLPANARLQNLAPMFGNEVQVQDNVVTLTLQPLQFEIIK